MTLNNFLPSNHFPMNIQFVFHNITEPQTDDIKALVENQINALSNYLQADITDDDSSFAKVAAEYFNKNNSYKISIQIHISGHPLYHAEEAKHGYDEAINIVRNKLQQQILTEKDKRKA